MPARTKPEKPQRVKLLAAIDKDIEFARREIHSMVEQFTNTDRRRTASEDEWWLYQFGKLRDLKVKRKTVSKVVCGTDNVIHLFGSAR